MGNLKGPRNRGARLLCSLLLLSIFSLFSLVRCTEETYRDGTYTGRSSPDDRGAYGEVELTLAEGKVRGCRFVTWQKDGTIKDEQYGKINGEISNLDYYEKAQLAVRAMEHYAARYVEVQDVRKLDQVEAVSGATIAYQQFMEAVEQALEYAREVAP
ncbi:MAG: FMN-binding protein [Spirochaetaceae bacterium]|nr:FMN-binding protein [Spirochaetaceae bacterium]